MNKEYYVYGAYGLHGELLYIGKGSGNRYQHCNSGISSNKALNRYYFSNGEGVCIKVRKLHTNLTNTEASRLETLEIKSLQPLFNIVGVSDSNNSKPSCIYEAIKQGFTIDFKKILKEYISSLETGCRDKQDIILSAYPELHHYVTTLGVKRIHSLRYRKKDIEIEYDYVVRKQENLYKVLSKMKLKSGDFITGAEFVEKLTSVYQSLGIDIKVTTRMIHQYYVVAEKFFVKNGKNTRGYKVISTISEKDLTDKATIE